ncbi:hypothetical protein [uncultured Sphingomonas sp.]|uniref:hypothetical protein n=1 Tax=uncultured Sphingomonas sp. TaxID=158754 RepID=UPI0025882C41|nr:hypothetical protein [uncultured Sphingomonas sp.]
MESWVSAHSIGPVRSLGPLLLNKVGTTFIAGAAVGPYAGHMWLDEQVGRCPETRALAGPQGYIGAYTSLENGASCEAVFEGSHVDGRQEGLTITAGTSVRVIGGHYRARQAGAGAASYPLSYVAGATVVLDGPVIDGDNATLASLTPTATAIVLAQPRIVGFPSAYVPIGRGHKITRQLAADQALTGTGAILGAGTTDAFNFPALPKGGYRVEFAGTYRLEKASVGMLMTLDGYGTRRIAGMLESSKTASDAAPTRGGIGVTGGSIFVTPDAINASRQFRSDFLYYAPAEQASGFNVKANPYNAATGLDPANGVLTIEAGATLTIERL